MSARRFWFVLGSVAFEVCILFIGRRFDCVDVPVMYQQRDGCCAERWKVRKMERDSFLKLNYEKRLTSTAGDTLICLRIRFLGVYGVNSMPQIRIRQYVLFCYPKNTETRYSHTRNSASHQNVLQWLSIRFPVVAQNQLSHTNGCICSSGKS